MKLIVLLTFIFILVSGCASNTQNKQDQSSKKIIGEKEVSKPVTAYKPNWVALTDGAELYFDANSSSNFSGNITLSNNMKLRSEDWDNYLRSYIESFPPVKRSKILDGVLRHKTEYDKVDKLIRFEPKTFLSGPYSKSSHIGVVGTLQPNKINAFIKFKFYGDSWIFAKSLKIVTDGNSYQSPILKFKRNSYGGKVWEIAYLNLNDNANRELINKIVLSKEAIVRFQGGQSYYDLEVTNRMREDISAMLKAIDIIRSGS